METMLTIVLMVCCFIGIVAVCLKEQTIPQTEEVEVIVVGSLAECEITYEGKYYERIKEEQVRIDALKAQAEMEAARQRIQNMFFSRERIELGLEDMKAIIVANYSKLPQNIIDIMKGFTQDYDEFELVSYICCNVLGCSEKESNKVMLKACYC